MPVKICMRHLWLLESFLYKQLISRLISNMKSRNEGTKPPPLSKQRKIVIVCLQRTIKDQCLLCVAKSQRQRSHICYSVRASIQIL